VLDPVVDETGQPVRIICRRCGQFWPVRDRPPSTVDAVNDEAGRQRLDRTGQRLVAGEILGGLCVVAAVWALADGWKALGVFGVALFTICQLIDRRTRPG